MLTTSALTMIPATPGCPPGRKFTSYLRHYDKCNTWLRQHGFKGLQAVPPEFQHQLSVLPKNLNNPKDGASIAAAMPLPIVSAISEKGVYAQVFVPQSEKRKYAQKSTQAIYPTLSSTVPTLDEEYIHALEINRRHIVERDRKYGTSGKSRRTLSKDWPAAIGPSGPPEPEVQYVDYTQVETYIARSIAPTHRGPKNNHLSHASTSRGKAGHSTTSAASISSSELTTNSSKAGGSQQVVKRFTKNKNRKIVCWQEQLREQEASRQGRTGEASWYERLYGSAATGRIKARETDLQLHFDRFSDRAQPKLWPQLPVRLNFKSNQ